MCVRVFRVCVLFSFPCSWTVELLKDKTEWTGCALTRTAEPKKEKKEKALRQSRRTCCACSHLLFSGFCACSSPESAVGPCCSCRGFLPSALRCCLVAPDAPANQSRQVGKSFILYYFTTFGFIQALEYFRGFIKFS